MKKSVFTIAFLSFCCSYGIAQVTPKPAAKKHYRKKKEVQQNFTICRSNSGYYICDEIPGKYNSTNPGITVGNEKPYVSPNSYVEHRKRFLNAYRGAPVVNDGTPPSQSYPENTHTVYGVGNASYIEPHDIVLGPFDYDY